MDNELLAGNAAMIRGSNVPVEPPSFEQHPEFKRLRRLLLVFNGIDLVLCLVNFLFVIHSYAASDSLESQTPYSGSQLGSIIISLIYYGFGLLVSYRYYQTGLLVFVLLGLILFFLTSALVIVLLIRIIHVATTEGFVTAGIIVAIIFVAVCCFILIFQLLIIRYAFKLYRLLKRNRRLTIEQI